MVDVERFTSALSRDPEGIWTSLESSEVSYPETGRAICMAVEDESFWFRHRNKCILAAVQRHLPITQGPVFDIGGGNGFVARELAEAGYEVVLVEPGPSGARSAKRRGLENVICATTETAKFSSRTLPAIGLFDVIEHIAGDRAFLVGLGDLMKPDGRLFITVPSYQWLWSQEDVDAGHFRRHTKHSISLLLKLSGFDIQYITYFFRPLPLPILLLRALPFRLRIDRNTTSATKVAKDHRVGAGLSAIVIERMLADEVTNIRKGYSMPFGTSLLIVACPLPGSAIQPGVTIAAH